MVDLDDIEVSKKESKNRKRNIYRYLLLLFAALVYAYFFGGLFPYTLLYLVIAMPIVSAVHLFVTVGFFRLSEKVSERTFIKGEYASYSLILMNSSIFYMPYITIHMQMEGQFILKGLRTTRMSLPPLTTREFKFDMPLLYRGRYEIGVNRIEIQDILGMFSYSIKPYELKSILVKPRLVSMDYKNMPFARISEGDLASGFQEVGNDEVRDIREYAYGDSLRKIHWKLSSKLSKTMVKDTRNELDNDVLVILNLSKPEKMSEEWLVKEDCIIEELVTQIYYLLRRNIPVKLCFFSNGPHTLRSTTIHDFKSVYQTLSEIKFDQEKSFNDIMDYFTDMELNSNLVYIFSNVIDPDMVSKAIAIKNKGFDLELYYTKIKDVADNDLKASSDLIELLIKSGIQGYHLQPRPLDVKEGTQEIKKEKVKLKAGVETYETHFG